uniref:Unannotated protein n=1 Tax=freshwater metagenome TaxID=449393 RepID=A0A6J7N4Q2_9ZZZZ
MGGVPVKQAEAELALRGDLQAAGAKGRSEFGRLAHAGKVRESIAICNYCRLAIGEDLQAMMFLPGLEPERSARDAGNGYEYLRTL